MEISQLKHILAESERIESIIYGIHESSFVVLVATNIRLHFIDRGLVSSRIDDFRYLHLESVKYDLSIFSGMVKISAAQGDIMLKFVPNRLIRDFTRTVEAHMTSQTFSGQSNQNEEEKEISELERLSKLHKDGELTDKEFKIEKTKVINSK